MKPYINTIVSDAQLGFVPGRVISEASHLVKLIQAYLDETDEEGVFLSADWEKAFDRCSWEYLHKAVKALGFGPDFQDWVQTLYNQQAAPIRQVKANGVRSATFTLGSGTPQGCPASPLFFLLIGEGLTRIIQEGDQTFGKLEGVKIGETEHLISQFADDTLRINTKEL